MKKEKRPIITPCEDGKTYKLKFAMTIQLHTGQYHRIPSGFTTDGASIPRLFWRVIDTPFSPDIIAAAIIHDSLYSTGCVSRKVADEEFSRRLKEKNGRIKSFLMWIGVRLGGWLCFNKKAKEREE